MGKTIRMASGDVVELVGDPNKSISSGGAKLGQGGQGAVFKVKNQRTGELLALKLYSRAMSAEFIDNLTRNAGNPPHPSFLWPIDITEPLPGGRYGYTMELYGSGYSSYVKIIKGIAKFPSKEMQIACLIDLVDAFEALHAKGYSYQDLNDGGVLFDCKNGKVLICDNDNVAPYGKNLGIIGKFRWMAPEVAIHMFKPDKHSDRFSLAVLMFYLLLHAHPYDGAMRLQGQCSAGLEEQVYGTRPVFIFHPTNPINRPDPDIDKNAIQGWTYLPAHIKELFIRTFTSGMPTPGMSRDQLERDRQNRVSEKDWKDGLHQWMDTLCGCPNCGKPLSANVQGDNILEQVCPHCNKKVKVTLPVLHIYKNGKPTRTIVLDADKEIAKSSVTNERSNDPAFTVIRSPKNKAAYGIRNLLKNQWTCTQAGANTRLVNTGEIVGAFNGVKIEFDYVYSGTITYNMKK